MFPEAEGRGRQCDCPQSPVLRPHPAVTTPDTIREIQRLMDGTRTAHCDSLLTAHRIAGLLGMGFAAPLQYQGPDDVPSCPLCEEARP